MVSRATKSEQKKYAVAGKIAEEVIGSIRTVLSFNGQYQEVEKLAYTFY